MRLRSRFPGNHFERPPRFWGSLFVSASVRKFGPVVRLGPVEGDAPRGECAPSTASGRQGGGGVRRHARRGRGIGRPGGRSGGLPHRGQGQARHAIVVWPSPGSASRSPPPAIWPESGTGMRQKGCRRSRPARRQDLQTCGGPRLERLEPVLPYLGTARLLSFAEDAQIRPIDGWRVGQIRVPGGVGFNEGSRPGKEQGLTPAPFPALTPFPLRAAGHCSARRR